MPRLPPFPPDGEVRVLPGDMGKKHVLRGLEAERMKWMLLSKNTWKRRGGAGKQRCWAAQSPSWASLLPSKQALQHTALYSSKAFSSHYFPDTSKTSL